MVIYGFLYRGNSLGRVRALLLPLLLGCHLYLYSCLIVVARISDTILSRNRESRHHCIVPDFREKVFKFKPLNMQLAVGLLWIFGCCELRYIPSKTNFDGVFNMNRWSFIPVLFLYLLKLSCDFYLFLKNVVYHNDWFLNIEASLHSWNKTTWPWCMILCKYCWIMFANILLRNFGSVRYLLLLFSRSVMSNSLWSHGLQHARLPCPSLSPMSLPKLMSIESVMPSKSCIICGSFLLLPSIFPSIRVFSNESVLPIRWPKYWSFSFSISLSNEHSGLISFRIDWFALAVQGTLKSLQHTTVQSINQSVLSLLYGPTLNIHTWLLEKP